MNLVNLTPHNVNVVDADGNPVLTLPPSGTVARVDSDQVVVDTINGVDVVRTVYGDVVDLPAPQADTVYVTSTVVMLRANRDDVVSPDTGPTALRNDRGHVIGVRRFQTS